MKNLFVACLVTFSMMIFLSSCGKEYNCTCTVDGTTEINVITAKKSKAEDLCATTEAGYQFIDPNASCTLN